MATSVPSSFKPVVPFIRRAEELDRDTTCPESKLIAYFCRQYAMELGIKLRENDPSNEATNFLLGLMDRLEADKSKLPTFTQDEGKDVCEQFANRIFTKADDEDRAGRADKNTARTFYAAGTFFDILNQFGDISEDIVEKRRYCKYKAASILKAIKEGVQPQPGPPPEATSEGGISTDSATNDEEQRTPDKDSGLTIKSEPSHKIDPPFPVAPTANPATGKEEHTMEISMASNSFSSAHSGGAGEHTSVMNEESTPTYSSGDRYSTSGTISPPLPQVALPVSPSIPVSSSRGRPASQNEINDAIECAKFAIAALKIKDIDLAAQRLEMALRSIR